MPKTRNEMTERAIRSATWHLFMEKGVQATTYSDIANRSGISRPLVQRYFPKKDLLVTECVAAIRTASVAACDEAFPEESHPLTQLYLRGQVNVATYFACDGLRAIMLDVFSSRELTRQAIADGFGWTLSQALPERIGAAADGMPDELVMAMGGLYELLFRHLERGTTPDVGTHTLPSVRAFAETFSVPLPPEGLEAHTIPADDLARLAVRAVSLVDWH